MDSPRQQRNYNHYSNNNQPHPTSRSLDNRVKIPYYLPEEEISYDERPLTRLENRDSMEGVYGDPENSGSRVLDNQSRGSRDINGSHFQGLNTEPQVILGPAGSGDGPKIPKESNTNLINDMTHDKQQSGKGQNISRHGSAADKELAGVTNSKDIPGANLPLTDPNELRQKVVESLVEKKKKAQYFITQESEGIARKETSPESKMGSTGTSTSEIGTGIDKSQQKVSASNPEREAALDALLAAAMGSAKSVSGKPDKHQTGSPPEPVKKEARSPVNDSLDQTRRRKHYPEDLKGVGLARGASGELHKTTSPTAGHDEVESSRRGSFAGQHALPRDERPLRPNKPTENLPRREGTQKDDHSQSSRPKISPPSASRQDTSRGQRSAYEREGTDRREDAQQELRHRAERFEDAPPLSAKEYRHPAEKLSASRRGDGDHRGKFPEEEKLRFRQEPLLYRPMDVAREDGPRDSYARYSRRPTEPSWPDVAPDPSPYPPGRYLPPRDDPRLPPISRPPETDYAALYYKDLTEWLELTGYHDYTYRQMVLRRQRELRVMEERRMVMEDDREAPRGYLTMPSREEVDPRDLRRTRGPPNYPMPSPGDRDPGGRAPEGGPHRSASRAGLYPPVPRPDDWPRYQGDFRISPPLGEVTTRKRRAPFLDDYDDLGPAGKLPRVNYESQHRAAIALPPNEHVNAEQSGTHNKHHPSHTELNDHRHPSRRVNKDRLEEPEDEASAVRQSLSKRIAAGRGHELSPPPLQEHRLRKRSLSPARHGYDNNDRKEGIKRERDGPTNKFRHDDDPDTAFVHPQRKGFDKGRRSPDLSPRYEKEFQKPGRSASGKFTPRDDFRKPFPARRNSSDEYRSLGDVVRRTSIDEHKKKPGFGRGRGRGYNKEFHSSTRYSRGMDHGDAMDIIDRRIESGLDTRNADTRYFVVKSFNHDNVKMAQKDELWATQKKNSDIFDEAFRTSHDVILVFSVNKSGKFQGYARMESPTGSAPVPTWAKNLLWESSGPFRIRWITINDIGFHRVAHLTNRLNEDQPVLIGRDGQEIDPECGANLCKLIDESANFHRNYNESGGK